MNLGHNLRIYGYCDDNNAVERAAHLALAKWRAEPFAFGAPADRVEVHNWDNRPTEARVVARGRTWTYPITFEGAS